MTELFQSESPRKCRDKHACKALSATLVADGLYEQKVEKNNQADQAVTNPKIAKNRLSEKSRVLVWEAINSATWRLIDPDGLQILVPRSHGQWPAFKTPTALAWVFDVGVDKTDWRARVPKRGGWRALGCFADVEVAKRMAKASIEVAP